jgi:predicted AAA+ superfamily ATPase
MEKGILERIQEQNEEILQILKKSSVNEGKYLFADEICEYLRISRSTFRNFIPALEKAGMVKVGGRWSIKLSNLDHFRYGDQY